MHSRWTGGQYSLYRSLLGLFFLIAFGGQIWNSAGSGAFHNSDSALSWALGYGLQSQYLLPLLAAAGLLASGYLILGKGDRWAAWWLFLLFPWPAVAPMLTPVIAVPHFLLLCHLFTPRAPYGSLDAKGRIDPGRNWRPRPQVISVAWLFLAAVYLANGILLADHWRTGEIAPLSGDPSALTGFGRLLWEGPAAEGMFVFMVVVMVSFAPMAIFARTRFWAWTALFALQWLLILSGSPLGQGFLLLLHLLAFDPGWLPTNIPRKPDILFYDGDCGLCHRAVRFVLAEDPDGNLFRIAPLGGETFQAKLKPDQQKGLPDSLVLRTHEGDLMLRSTAALAIAKRLGGWWRVIGWLGSLAPRFLRDAVYDFIAKIRYRLFKRPTSACPILPKHLRARFLG